MVTGYGRYLGTEIDEKWWKCFTKNGFFLRGNGEYWYDDKGFNFLRYLTKEPLTIPFSKGRSIEVGYWHGGRWAWGKPIVKLVWIHRGHLLSSGFTLASKKTDVLKIANELSQWISNPTFKQSLTSEIGRAGSFYHFESALSES